MWLARGRGISCSTSRDVVNEQAKARDGNERLILISYSKHSVVEGTLAHAINQRKDLTAFLIFLESEKVLIDQTFPYVRIFCAGEIGAGQRTGGERVPAASDQTWANSLEYSHDSYQGRPKNMTSLAKLTT